MSKQITKPDLEKRSELAKICPALYVHVWGSTEYQLRKRNEFNDTDAIEIEQCLLALAEENKELKDVLEAEGYRFPEREFPDEIPDKETPPADDEKPDNREFCT